MMHIRETRQDDLEAIVALASQERLFTDEEAACVNELGTDYLTKDDHNGYIFLTAEEDGEVAGFACYGQTSLTDRTYTLYWLCIGDGWKRRGIGSLLMDTVEREVRAAHGRMLVLDTSGSEDYAGTRAFYESMGYERVATIPDFYSEGDDLCIYRKRLTAPRESNLK